MLIQTLVFAFVFKLRLSGDNSEVSYVAYLLVGLAPWLAFQEAIGRAPFCFFESKNLVKQVIFPIEILPVKIVLASVVTLLVGLIFPMGIMIFSGSTKLLMWILLPFALSIQLLMTIGLTFFISALSVYLRDTKTLVQLFLMVGLFLHPILYTPGLLPQWAETAFQLSPLSHLLWVYRDILIFGQVTHLESWILAPIFALLSVAWGYRLFSNLAPKFGDIL
jgi:lipopolysaccharide transport system permease protein